MKAWQGDAPQNKIFSGADCWLGLVPYPIAKCIFDVACFVICCVLLCRCQLTMPLHCLFLPPFRLTKPSVLKVRLLAGWSTRACLKNHSRNIYGFMGTVIDNSVRRLGEVLVYFAFKS